MSASPTASMRPQTQTAAIRITQWLRHSILGFLILVASSISAQAQIAANPTEQRVLDFAQSIGNDVVETLAVEGLSQEQRNQKLIAILDKAIDLQILGKAVLARHWRGASKDQRNTYLNLFRELAVVQLSKVLAGYSFNGETYEIIKIVTLRQDKLWSVHTKIIRPSQSDILVEWVILQKKSQELALFDLKAEQFSLVNTKRDEFSAVVSRDGMDGLIKLLEEQIQS